MHLPLALSACLLAITVLIRPCTAQDLPCTCTQNRTGTFYRVQLNETDGCLFNWSNSTGYTIANYKDKQEVAISCNITTLFIRMCYEQVTLTLECMKEKLVQHTANCTTTCSESTVDSLTGTPRQHWTLLGPVIFFIATIFAVVWRICDNRKVPS